MAREAYATFRHPAVAPLVQLGPNCFVSELFHGPTLAFKDLAMQLLARLMDHALAQRGERTTIVVATSGDTGGAAVEAFRGRAQVDVIVLFPARPHLRGAAADDDHGARRQRPRGRDRRHLRRLPGDREGPVQPSCLPRPRAALGRQLHQLGAHRRAGGLLFHRRGRARRARLAKSPSRCRPEISATCSPATWRPAWGCRSSGWSSPPTSTTSWRARLRPAPTSCATWWRPPRPRWTSRCRRISSGCCSRPMAATPARCAR